MFQPKYLIITIQMLYHIILRHIKTEGCTIHLEFLNENLDINKYIYNVSGQFFKATMPELQKSIVAVV